MEILRLAGNGEDVWCVDSEGRSRLPVERTHLRPRRVLTESGAGSSRLQGKAELSSRLQNDGMRAESRIVAAVLTVLLHLFILSALAVVSQRPS